MSDESVSLSRIIELLTADVDTLAQYGTSPRSRRTMYRHLGYLKQYATANESEGTTQSPVLGLKAGQPDSVKAALLELKERVEAEQIRFGGEDWKAKWREKEINFAGFSQGYLQALIFMIEFINAVTQRKMKA